MGRSPILATVLTLAAALGACAPEEEPEGAAPTPGPTATPTPSPTPVAGPSPSPTSDTAAAALLACLEQEDLEAEEGPSGDLSEAFQVGVGDHPRFRYQAIVLGYEDREEAVGDRRDLVEGAEQIGGELPDIRLVGRTLILVLDEEVAGDDLAALEACARSAA